MEANQAQVLTCAFLGSQTTNPRLPESKYYRNLVSWVASVSVTVVSLAVTHHAADYGTRTEPSWVLSISRFKDINPANNSSHKITDE